MAIDQFAAELLAFARDKGASFGSVLTIGRQNLDFAAHLVADVEKVLKVEVGDLVANGPDEAWAEPLFERLGAGALHSLDMVPYEGAAIQHDMNEPVPEDLQNRFDVVLDGGSLEHIFNAPQALANCMRMVKEGGMLLSVTPADQLNGHGFFQFSPEYFYRSLCPANGYSILGIAICEIEGRRRRHQVKDPAITGNRAMYIGDGASFVAVAAKKLKHLPPFESGWPQQADYVTRWDASQDEGPSRGVDPAEEEKEGKVPASGLVKRVLPAEVRRRMNDWLLQRRYHREFRDCFVEIPCLTEMTTGGEFGGEADTMEAG